MGKLLTTEWMILLFSRMKITRGRGGHIWVQDKSSSLGLEHLDSPLPMVAEAVMEQEI